MAANFNKVIIAGNLTRDPETRYTPTGLAICKISVAINEKRKDKDGQLKEAAVFVDVDSFGKQAETVGQYFKKGNPILVEGRLKLDTWDDKTTGKPKSRLGVVMEQFQFMASKSADGATNERRPATAKPAGQPVEEAGIDDVPF